MARALDAMDACDAVATEPRQDAQDTWNASVQSRMAGTVWTSGGCASWYIDRNGRNTTLWPDYTFSFRAEMRRFEAGEYHLIGATVPEPEPARVERVAVPA